MKNNKNTILGCIYLLCIFSFEKLYPDDSYIYQGISFHSETDKKAFITIKNAKEEVIGVNILPNERVAVVVKTYNKIPISLIKKSENGKIVMMARNQRAFLFGLGDTGLFPPTLIGGYENKYWFMHSEKYRIINIDPDFFIPPFEVTSSFEK